jgi:SAM-dependent methyltransferase
VTSLIGQEVDVERFMHRIRAEAANATSDGRDKPIEHATLRSDCAEIQGAPLPRRPMPSPAYPHAPEDMILTIPDEDSDPGLLNYQSAADGSHNLETLLNYDDREFIQAAYLALMTRAPDSGGFDTYLRLLRSGTSKLEILCILRDSAEGRAAAARVVGLPGRLFLEKLRGWPIIGPLAGLLTSLWNLPRVECRQRVLDGRLFSLIDQASNRARTSQAVIKRALKDLEAANRQLVEYAASKPGYDDLQGSLDAVWLSLDALQRDKTDVEQILQFTVQLGENARALDTLESVKADRSAVDESHELLTHALAAKAERQELAALNSRLMSKAEVADVDHLQSKLIEVASALDAVHSVKADRSSVEETRHLLTLALAAKAERHEITALTNHLVGLIQSRAKREDLVPIEETCAQLIRQAANDRSAFEAGIDKLTATLGVVHEDAAARRESLIQLRTHYETIESAHTQGKERTEAALNDLNKTLLGLAHDKVDCITLEATQTETRMLLERARAETEERLGSVVHSLNDKLEMLDQSKINRDAAYASIAEAEARTEGAWNKHLGAVVQSFNAKLEVLDRSKINHDAADAAVTGVEARIGTALNSLNEMLRAISHGKADRAAFESTQSDMRTSLGGLRAETDLRLNAAVDSLNSKLDSLAQSKIDRNVLLAETRTSVEEARRQAQEALHLALVPIEARTSDIRRNLLDQERRLGMFLEEARKRLPKPLSTTQLANLVAEEDHLLDAMYASFEDMFRGTREDIKNRARIYLPHIRAAKVDLAGAPVIDLGCGRGEWLELLRDENISSRGVDINRVFLDACRAMELDAKESDAVTFLRNLKPNSVAAVTSFHLIEHLPLKSLIALIDESLRVLKPGGLIILETPNPENLEVGGCNFYTDPTHRNPLPPPLTLALVELRGFVRPIVIRRDQERIRKHVPPLVSVDQPIARSINPIVELIRDHFYVSPDYAVVATKA